MRNCVYVGNLPRDCSEEQLRELFSGEDRPVEAVNIMKDKRSGRSRGFAFVELASEEAASAAIEEARGTELDGRRLEIGRAYAPPMGKREVKPDRGDFRPRRSGRRGRR